jgi:Dynamin family
MKHEPDLMNLMAQQIELLKDVAYSDWAVRLESAQNRLRDGRFNLLFVGDYSRGKSTLLNAFLGEEVLAVSAVPVPTINRIEHSDRPFANVQGADGRQQSVPLSALLETDYAQVDVGYPVAWLPTNVTMIEQPTLEEPDTFSKAVAQADWIVVVVSSDSLYSMNEQRAVDQIKTAGHRGLLFVCSCFDRIPSAEQPKLQEAAYVRLPVNPDQIFFLSAEKVLQGDPRAIAALEKFKEALLNGLAAGGHAFKQERAQRLLQQAIAVAKTAIDDQQAVQAQNQAAEQSHQRELELTYEDTAAIGRELEADLSDFRQRTGEVVQAMTNTFIRNLAQETANWIETTDTTLSPSAIEKQIRSTIRRWQQNELEPYLRAQMSHQARDLQTQSQAFNRQINGLYAQMGTADPTAVLALNFGDVPIGEVSLEVNDLPLVDADDSSSELFNPSRIVISLAMVAVTLLVIRPFFLAIPASLAGLGATTFFSMTRSQSRQSSSRHQLARAYEQAIRRQADPISLQILNAINARLDELQRTVRSHISACLKPVQQYLQAAPTEAAEAEVMAYQYRLQEIEQAFRQLFPT